MNPITIGMDLLLAGLLLAALLLGVRLNGRLKALKESHAGFAIAVQTLDAAAAKADGALKALHAASEDAHDSLLARIDTARSLALKLEKATESAENAARRAEDAVAKLAAAPQAPPIALVAANAAPRRSLGDLLSGYAPRGVAERDVRAAPEPPPISTPRRRPIADEDLFAEAEEGVRPGLTGLMRMSLGQHAAKSAR